MSWSEFSTGRTRNWVRSHSVMSTSKRPSPAVKEILPSVSTTPSGIPVARMSWVSDESLDRAETSMGSDATSSFDRESGCTTVSVTASMTGCMSKVAKPVDVYVPSLIE